MADTPISFTVANGKALQIELKTHFSHYQKVETLRHAFNKLHRRYFEANTLMEESKDAVREKLHLFKYRVQSAYHRMLLFTDNYASFLKFKHLDFVVEIKQHIRKINASIELYNDLYGSDFDKQSSLQNARLKLLSVFSKRHQEIIDAKNNLLAQYKGLADCYKKQQLFVTKLPAIAKESKLQDIKNKLAQFQIELELWEAKVPAFVEKEVRQFSSATLLPDRLKHERETLLDGLDELVETINTAVFLREPLSLDTNHKLVDLEKFVFSLLQEFQLLENEWKDFDVYHSWRQDWLKRSDQAQQIIQALVKTSAKDWETAFLSWFYYNLLEQYYSAELPNKSLPFGNYLVHLKDLQLLVNQKAMHRSVQRQKAVNKRLKTEKDAVLSKAAQFFEGKSLQEIIHWLGIDRLTELFPVIIATPAQAKTLLNAKAAIADIVFIENADQLDQEEYMEILKLGNQLCMLGAGETASHDSLFDWLFGQRVAKFKPQINTKVIEEEATGFDLYNQLNDFQLETTLPDAIKALLAQYIDKERILINVRVENALVDLLILPKDAQHSPVAILCDAGLIHQPYYDFNASSIKARTLRTRHYPLIQIWSVHWWQNSEQAFQKLLAQVLQYEQSVPAVVYSK